MEMCCAAAVIVVVAVRAEGGGLRFRGERVLPASQLRAVYIYAVRESAGKKWRLAIDWAATGRCREFRRDSERRTRCRDHIRRSQGCTTGLLWKLQWVVFRGRRQNR